MANALSWIVTYYSNICCRHGQSTPYSRGSSDRRAADRRVREWTHETNHFYVSRLHSFTWLGPRRESARVFLSWLLGSTPPAPWAGSIVVATQLGLSCCRPNCSERMALLKLQCASFGRWLHREYDNHWFCRTVKTSCQEIMFDVTSISETGK
jgi:hypothetical protein